MTHHAKVFAGGKIVIPAELRREFGIKEGDSLLIERDDKGGLVIRTYEQVVREVQTEFRTMIGDVQADLVDELIADRHAEAHREDAAGRAGRAPGA